MAAPREVEIKFRLTDRAALQRRLRTLGFRRITPRTFESNTLYDFRGGSLRGRGQLLRLRRYGDAWTLTFKGKGRPGRHKSRREIESAVAHGEPVAEIFAALGLAPTFRYEKYRSEWSDGSGMVVLDETPVGDFGEIEGAPAWIDRTARALGLSRRDYITDSYAQIFLQWKKSTRSPAREMTCRACVKGCWRPAAFGWKPRPSGRG